MNDGDIICNENKRINIAKDVSIIEFECEVSGKEIKTKAATLLLFNSVKEN